MKAAEASSDNESQATSEDEALVGRRFATPWLEAGSEPNNWVMRTDEM